MSIRSINEKDIRQVLNIYNWYIENTSYTLETERLNFAQFRNRIRDITAFYPWIVLEDNGIILGYAYLSSFNQRSAYQWSADLSLYLHHDSIHQGLGSMLYKEIEKRAIEQGFINLISIITSENPASLAFHKKHGFKECGFLDTVGYKKNWLGVTFCKKKIQNESNHPESVKPYTQTS